MSGTERAELARVERYLNTLKTVSAYFLQYASTGAYAEGRLSLSRPGRMRLDYKPPVRLQIFADGDSFIFIDHELENVTYVPLSATPASLLIETPVRLTGGDISVSGLARQGEKLRLTLERRDDPDLGSVTLQFAAEPLQLEQWEVTDAQGITVRVALVDPVFNQPIADELFEPEIDFGPNPRD